MGATALIAAAVVYLVAEAISASAWTDPPYSYGYNKISDLGVPSCGGEVLGREICSPLYGVMNTGFVLQGVLFVVGAVLLHQLLPGGFCHAYLGLAIVLGVGITLVGLVHGSPEAAADGSVTWHILGAVLAIVGGNLASIVVGWFALRSPAGQWLGITWIVLGVVGLISLALLQAFTGNESVVNIVAWFERGAVYPITAAELISGLALLRSWRSARAAPAQNAPALS